jgi:trigger factor
VPVDFPADHPMPALAGQHAQFALKVREVHRLELPELTDEVAARLSEFDTADALRADIEASIVKRLDSEIDGIFRANAVRALGDAAEVEHPAALVERRQQEAYAELKGQLDRAGLSIEQYLAGSGQDMTELFAQLDSTARDEVARELSLLALAEQAGIVITEDDLRAEITEHAEATGEDVEGTIARILGGPNADLLRGELLIQRTIDHLVKTVKPVEVELPSPEEQAAQADAAAANADATETPVAE